jgi:hypothetical protein
VIRVDRGRRLENGAWERMVDSRAARPPKGRAATQGRRRTGTGCVGAATGGRAVQGGPRRWRGGTERPWVTAHHGSVARPPKERAP